MLHEVLVTSESYPNIHIAYITVAGGICILNNSLLSEPACNQWGLTGLGHSSCLCFLEDMACIKELT
jgi:hypothetical protein